jgi:hypothetical protein
MLCIHVSGRIMKTIPQNASARAHAAIVSTLSAETALPVGLVESQAEIAPWELS